MFLKILIQSTWCVEIYWVHRYRCSLKEIHHFNWSTFLLKQYIQHVSWHELNRYHVTWKLHKLSCSYWFYVLFHFNKLVIENVFLLMFFFPIFYFDYRFIFFERIIEGETKKNMLSDWIWKLYNEKKRISPDHKCYIDQFYLPFVYSHLVIKNNKIHLMPLNWITSGQSNSDPVMQRKVCYWSTL